MSLRKAEIAIMSAKLRQIAALNAGMARRIMADIGQQS
jgi:hypothetical protein